ncbi:Putative ribonuclease H protein At1g65750 [Linum perenne]
MHLVSSEQICKPKAKGGMGLRLAHHLKIAFMAKLAFLFFQDSEALWVQVLHTKYFREVEGVLRPQNHGAQSNIWRGISNAWQVILKGARSGIQNGIDTHLWTTRWLDSGSKLIDKVVRNDDDIDLEAPVCDFAMDSGGWDADKLRQFLDEEKIGEIMGMMPPYSSRGTETWVWSGESNCKFSIRSAMI